jgi:membrane-associated phospholipid phosphatase
VAADKKLWQYFAFGLVAIALAHALDSWFYLNFRMAGIYEHDWGRALRVLGHLPVWLVAALALALHDREVRGYRRAALLAVAPALGGIVAEVLKLLLRRLRPYAADGAYVFRPFSERTFSTGGIALPSSHALVAFAGAAMLARLFPRAKWVWWGMAWGCGLSRVAAGAHFLSDIVVAAVVAWALVAALWQAWQPRSEP